MKVFLDEIRMDTKKDYDMVDITDKVRESAVRSDIKNGILTIFCRHTTAAVRIGEYEDGLMEDYHNTFEKLIPKETDYGHNRTSLDGRANTHAHLRSMILNSSEIIPLKDGKLMLGTWQTVFFIEMDGPRQNRNVVVEVIGE